MFNQNGTTTSLLSNWLLFVFLAFPRDAGKNSIVVGLLLVSHCQYNVEAWDSPACIKYPYITVFLGDLVFLSRTPIYISQTCLLPHHTSSPETPCYFPYLSNWPALDCTAPEITEISLHSSFCNPSRHHLLRISINMRYKLCPLVLENSGHISSRNLRYPVRLTITKKVLYLLQSVLSCKLSFEILFHIIAATISPDMSFHLFHVKHPCVQPGKRRLHQLFTHFCRCVGLHLCHVLHQVLISPPVLLFSCNIRFTNNFVF